MTGDKYYPHDTKEKQVVSGVGAGYLQYLALWDLLHVSIGYII